MKSSFLVTDLCNPIIRVVLSEMFKNRTWAEYKYKTKYDFHTFRFTNDYDWSRLTKFHYNLIKDQDRLKIILDHAKNLWKSIKEIINKSRYL